MPRGPVRVRGVSAGQGEVPAGMPSCVHNKATHSHPSQLTLAQRGREGPSRPHSDPAKQWPGLVGGPLRPRSETFWVRS